MMYEKCWICAEAAIQVVDPLCSNDVVPTVCLDCAKDRAVRAFFYERYLRDFHAQKR